MSQAKMQRKSKYSLGLLLSASLILLLVNFINNTKLTYIPRAAEMTDAADTRPLTGPNSPGSAGPMSQNPADFNCSTSTNTCAEDIQCGYCRQHDTDCRMYLCVGPNYNRGEGRQTYSYSVYMPYPACPKPAKLKATCTAVVAWEETINKTTTKFESEIPATHIKELSDGSHVGLVNGLGYMLLD